MNLSLRSKFFFLVVATVALAAVPIIWMTMGKLTELSLKREQESFGNIVVLVEDSISSRYLNLLSTNIISVLQRKNQLRQMAFLTKENWMEVENLPAQFTKNVLARWSASLKRFGLYLEIFENSGAERVNDQLIQELCFNPERLDLKGRPLRDLLQYKRLPADGEFAVFELERSRVKDLLDSSNPLLVYFLPVPEREAVVLLALQLADMQQLANTMQEQIVAATQEKFESLKMHESGLLMLLSGNGDILAFKGNAQGRATDFVPQAALAQAKREGFADFVDQSKDLDMSHVFRLAYFKALDWYIVTAVSRAAMEAPTKILLQRMIAFALGSAILSVFGMMLVTARVIKPLRLLTNQAKTLAGIDLTQAVAVTDAAQSPLLALAKELPVEQHDEVGTLAQAFAEMGQTLDQNIRDLMLATATKERIEGELNAARDIQMGILPAADAATHPEVLVATFLEPAKEVGGDLYDFFLTPDGRQALIIGDVSDKGVPAALFMSMTVTLIRYVLSAGIGPAEAMTRVNDQLSAYNPGCMFVTLFIGLLDTDSGELVFANGGHCQPLVVDAQGQVHTIAAMSGPVVGAMPDLSYQSQRMVLEEQETCLLYSDGVTEAMDTQQHLLGERRLQEVMGQCSSRTPDAVVKAVHAAVLNHRGQAIQNDDITMLCFARRKK